MNGDDGWYLHPPEPAGPPDPPSNWAAKREMKMAFLLLGFHPRVVHRKGEDRGPER